MSYYSKCLAVEFSRTKLISIFIVVITIVFNNISGIHSTIPTNDVIQEYYVAATVCNVTHYDVTSSPRGLTHCASFCLTAETNNNCSGFRFQGIGNGCKLFKETDISKSASPCNSTSNVTLVGTVEDIYVKSELIIKYNLTTRDLGISENNIGTTCKHGGLYNQDTNKCDCSGGWMGEDCTQLAQDCSDLHKIGVYTTSGIYTIKPSASPVAFEVYCFLTTGFALTQIQAHLSKGYHFNRTWDEYKNGFNSSPSLTNSWLGNDYIHYISKSNTHRLLLDIKNGSSFFQFHYHGFQMENETYDYTMSFASYSSSPSGMTSCWPQLSIPFSTFDRDNDANPMTNCAARHGAGWWYEGENCTLCNINGIVSSDTMTRTGSPEEVFILPIDPDFSPSYVLMALFWLP